jgi:hypothetical protein
VINPLWYTLDCYPLRRESAPTPEPKPRAQSEGSDMAARKKLGARKSPTPVQTARAEALQISLVGQIRLTAGDFESDTGLHSVANDPSKGIAKRLEKSAALLLKVAAKVRKLAGAPPA